MDSAESHRAVAVETTATGRGAARRRMLSWARRRAGLDDEHLLHTTRPATKQQQAPPMSAMSIAVLIPAFSGMRAG